MAAGHKQGLVDMWTPGHILAGVITAAAKVEPVDAFVLFVLFEMTENVFAEFQTTKSAFPGSGTESWQNALADIGFNLAGYYGTRYVRALARR